MILAQALVTLGVIAGSVVLLGAAWVIVTYNRLVSVRNHVRESWADIDTELKRRYELIPNLVETVKGYAAHERETFERVVKLRNQAMAAHDTAESHAADESQLMVGMKQVFALVERYPELKSSQSYQELHRELALTEDRIAAARRFFNANVREQRTLCEMFPTSVVAGAFGFERPTYFELASDAERVVPRVDFQG